MNISLNININSAKMLNSISKRFEKYNKTTVLEVGIFDADNAKIAYYNEFGTSKIPARPFIRRTIREKKNQLLQMIGRLLKTKDINQSFAIAGEFLANAMKMKIVNGVFIKNAPSTVRNKGFNKPLIHTGSMVNSIKFKVYMK